MISKRIQGDPTWNNSEASATLLRAFSKGFDREQLQKVAYSGSPLAYFDIDPKKDHSYIHLIALGAGEVYGSNNNADYYNKDKGVRRAADGTVIRLTGGLPDFHKSFERHAKVYREHANSRKGGTPLGSIVVSEWNPSMARVELIVEVPDSNFEREIQDLSEDRPVMFSIGAAVPEDICAVCSNHARTRKQYCTHLKYQKHEILPSGHQVFAYNDKPMFHDISFVRNPADRTAFALRKVASSSSCTQSYEDLGGLWVPASVVAEIGTPMEKRRSAAINKLATIEKRIQAEGSTLVEHDLACSFDKDDLSPMEIDRYCRYPLGDLLSSLIFNKILLPPRTFACIVLQRPTGAIPGIEGIEDILPDIFSQLVDEGGPDVLDSVLPSDANVCCGCPVDDLKSRFSIDDLPTRDRIITLVVGKPLDKVAHGFLSSARNAPAQSRQLARLYADYQIRLAEAHPLEKIAQRIVLRNQSPF